MNYTIPQLLLLFFIYGFLGWCTEVAYAAFQEGRFVNRGFLNGPICPIYGFGVVGVVLLLRPVGNHLGALFLGSLIVTTAIEFVTGFILEKIFHARWWDYSKNRFNIMGYVCLRFSLIWGLACVVVVRFVHPAIYSLVCLIPQPLLIALLCLFSALLIVDMAATLATIRKLGQRLRALTELAQEIRGLSDEIGQRISDSTLSVKQRAAAREARADALSDRLASDSAHGMTARLEQGRNAMAERLSQSREAVAERLEQSADTLKRRLAALKERFSGTLNERPFGQKRLISAFPHMTSHSYQEALSALRESYARRKKEKRSDGQD